MRPKHCFNRELSWLEFNARVLEEARDASNPLLERLRFLSIVSSNLDEFFMVRVASLKAMVREGDTRPDPSGLSPAEQCAAVSRRVRETSESQYSCLAELLPALDAEGVSIARAAQWKASERRWLEESFAERVFPLLTPQRVQEEGDSDRLRCAGNLRIHVAFSLVGPNGEAGLAAVQVPPNVDRFVLIPSQAADAGEKKAGRLRIALLEDLVEAFGGRLFPGWDIVESVQFKVTRDADFGVDEERDEDFLAAMEEVLASRQNSWPVRLTVTAGSPDLADRLRAVLGLESDDVHDLPGPIDLRGFMELTQADWIPAVIAARLRYKPWPPIPALEPPEGRSFWDLIDSGDRLLHVPYESFDPVLRFIDEAADDPSVLAIKMILYRTSGSSPVVRALTRAAGAGKQVSVLVELKARFDEERNMAWASRLEQAGAIVIYGIARLKVHAKAALVVRRTGDGGIRRYLHLSTGNYNDKTARMYADVSLFTANDGLCREAAVFFNSITGYSAVQALGLLAMSPFDLKSRLIGLIRREAQRSSPESPGLIMAKMNALADADVIEALYEASAAGVRISLNVRGVCTLVPGVAGLSESISVVSVVGRHLEHARIAYFRNGGAEEVYLSSADWLPRNLERRVELMIPVLDERIRRGLQGILEAYFKDNVKAHRLLPSGKWERVARAAGEKTFSAQDFFYETAKRRRELEEAPTEELQVRRRPG